MGDLPSPKEVGYLMWFITTMSPMMGLALFWYEGIAWRIFFGFLSISFHAFWIYVLRRHLFGNRGLRKTTTEEK